jgi:hypothetical protein
MNKPDQGIRPSPEALRRLPTLKVETEEDGSEYYQERVKALGIDVRLELKLETQTCKYWLCTRGADKPGPGVLPNWIVGYVTPESKLPGSKGEMGQPYGPEQTDRFQELDYMNLIKEEIDLMAEENDRNPSDEWEEKLKAARAEYHAVVNKLRE